MKGEVIAESAVRFVRELEAPAEKIWAFLTESARLPEWYGEGSIEPREGGAVSLMGGHIRGVVTGWRPNQFLGYTWNVFSPGETVSHFPVSYPGIHDRGLAPYARSSPDPGRDAEPDHDGLAHDVRSDRGWAQRRIPQTQRSVSQKCRAL
jgi:uncharacterized protein YndB with AHSA1/START domain